MSGLAKGPDPLEIDVMVEGGITAAPGDDQAGGRTGPCVWEELEHDAEEDLPLASHRPRKQLAVGLSREPRPARQTTPEPRPSALTSSETGKLDERQAFLLRPGIMIIADQRMCCSRFMIFRPSIGSIFERRIRSNRRSRQCGTGRGKRRAAFPAPPR